jgi:hypothetical protein
MKHTAVDWMFDQLWETPKDKLAWFKILMEAKEMQEGQIALAYSTGALEGVNKNFTNGYTYYKKTYGDK